MKRQPEIKGNRKYFKTLATMGEGKDRSKSRKRKKRGAK